MATATTIVLAIGIGGGIGVISGGFVGQWLYTKKSEWSMSLFSGSCMIVAAPPMWYLINADVANALRMSFFMAVLTGFLSSTMGPNMRAMMMNVNEPETRGVALALQITVDDLGKGLGPALVAVLISSVGRETAFNIATAGWVPCGILVLGTALTLKKDEAAMQERLERTLNGGGVLVGGSSNSSSVSGRRGFLELPPLPRDGPSRYL